MLDPTVTVVIPWRTADPDPLDPRNRALAYMMRWWRDFSWATIVSGIDCPVEEFSRSASINLAARDADTDVLVVADADVVVDYGAIHTAVKSAAEWPGMVFPFDRYRLLTSAETEQVYVGALPEDVVTSPPILCVSGCFAISRKGFEEVGGFDERFVGWGGEDVAFESACSTMLGPTRRVLGETAFHFWHPPAPTNGSKWWDLSVEYQRARGDRAQMAAVLAGRP